MAIRRMLGGPGSPFHQQHCCSALPPPTPPSEHHETRTPRLLYSQGEQVAKLGYATWRNYSCGHTSRNLITRNHIFQAKPASFTAYALAIAKAQGGVCCYLHHFSLLWERKRKRMHNPGLCASGPGEAVNAGLALLGGSPGEVALCAREVGSPV